ncbi:hypothetical protein BH11PAT4_BH11PAT4_2760 [soil metagenome]
MEGTDFSTGAATTSSSVGSIVLLVILLLLTSGGIFAYVKFLAARLKARYTNQLGIRALKVSLPKQGDEDDSKRDPKELTSLMESVYASIQHFYEADFKKRIWQGQSTFSFEIVAQHGEIFFYVAGPQEHLPSMERQIHAQYPSAQIELASDYDLFLEPDGQSAVAAVELMKPEIFPIKTYKGMEGEPLNVLTNVLSKLADGKAAIQVLVQPTDQSWQNNIQKALHNVQQGKEFVHQHGFAQKGLAFATDIGKAAAGKTTETENNEAMNTSKANVRLTAMQEQQAKLLVEKGSKLGFKTQIRVVARAASVPEAQSQVQTMLSAFSQFQSPEANGFKATGRDNRRLLVDYILRTFSPSQKSFILNTEELTSLFHFPNRHLDTPNVHWLGAKRLPPPINLPQSGALMGFSAFRGSEVPIYINGKDRMRHMYAIGQTGVGKTNLYQNVILQDIRAGHGVCYMDPNGDAVEWILRHIPKERAEDVIYFNPADTARPIALNLLEFDPAYPEQKTMVINEIISIFDKLYDLKATGGPIFEQYLRNAALLIMEDPESGSTLMEIPRVLSDEAFRKYKLSKCRNQTVVDFWVKEAEKAGGEAALQNIVPYITSKLTQFTSSDIMRPIVGQQKSAFNFRDIMDNKKILLVALPKGLLGDMSASLLGMIISSKIQIAAFSRQNQPEEARVPFYLYVDEFQNFTSKTFATILSEARKYALSLNITHQYIEQLDEDTRNAVFGNVGTIISWRIGAPDAEFMVKIMDPLNTEDLINVEKYNYYVRLMIDSAPSKPFNVTTYPPDPHENVQVGEAIRELSRLKFGRDRDIVEAEVRMRSKSASIAA